MNIIIPGPPIAQKRHRRKNIGGKIWDYDPLNTTKDKLGHLLKRHCPIVPAFENYFVIMKFYIPIPKSTSKKKRTQMFFQPCPKKPDIDNYAKFYLDAGNGILWSDDAKIVDLSCKKIYSDNPRTEIYIGSCSNE
jgi:Holliday junction resolvase RusA-like endonuclease